MGVFHVFETVQMVANRTTHTNVYVSQNEEKNFF